MQKIAKDCVPAGAPDQLSCGLRFLPRQTRVLSLGIQNANSPEIGSLSRMLWLLSFTVCLLLTGC